MDNTSLESTFHWLSEDVLKFEVSAGFLSNWQKYNTSHVQNGRSAARCSGDVMATIRVAN